MICRTKLSHKKNYEIFLVFSVNPVTLLPKIPKPVFRSQEYDTFFENVCKNKYFIFLPSIENEFEW